MVLNIDFAPTFAGLAGAPIPPTHTVNGMSVVPLLSGEPTTWRADILNEHWGGQIPDNALVRDARYKYVEYETGESELYDLAVDPHELDNRTNDAGYAAVKAALAARLAELRAE